MLTLNDGRSELWQWDTGRTLTVDADCSQVHFSNKVFGRSIDVDVVDGVAIVPDILLQTDKDLNVWAFVGTAENGYTKISKTFKVNRRNKPADYVFTPPDQTTLGELVERLGKIEESQDPDAIKNAVDDYLANNPIMVKETDPTVPEWAKQPHPPDVKIPDKLPNPHSITFTGAVDASYDGSNPVEIKIPDSGGNVDLTGYATEQFVRDGFQPKGDYLESSALPTAVNDALAQAKASGEFDGKDGKDGYTPIKGVDYFDGRPGQPGKDGEPGKDYILTEADKQEIAEQAAELVEVPEVDLNGLVKSVNGVSPDENGNVEIVVSGGGGKEWTKVREEFLYEGGESGISGRYSLTPKIPISADFTEAFVMALVTNNTSNTGHRINCASELIPYITGSTMTPKGTFLLAYHAVRFENRIVISSLDGKGTHTSIEIARIATGNISLYLHWSTIAAGESISSVGEVMYR